MAQNWIINVFYCLQILKVLSIYKKKLLILFLLIPSKNSYKRVHQFSNGQCQVLIESRHRQNETSFRSIGFGIWSVRSFALATTTWKTLRTINVTTSSYSKLKPNIGNWVAMMFFQVFRHGNRNPTEGSIWDGNSYNNASFYPEGYGQLTNVSSFVIFLPVNSFVVSRKEN